VDDRPGGIEYTVEGNARGKAVHKINKFLLFEKKLDTYQHRDLEVGSVEWAWRETTADQ